MYSLIHISINQINNSNITVPEVCNPLKRGGLRINVQAMNAVKVKGDGLCLWASLAHFSELNKYEIRQQVCEQYVVHNGSEKWNGKSYESWIKAETDFHGEPTCNNC